MVTKPSFLLKGFVDGQLKISENDNTAMVFHFEPSNINIDIVDCFFLKTPKKEGFVSMLLKARNFANLLNRLNLTIKISHKKTDLVKLGNKVNSGFSKAFTLSSYIEILNFSEIRKLKRTLEN